MSNANATVEQTRAQNEVDRRNAIGVIRRMAIRVTSGALWHLAGVLLADGKKRETAKVEPFTGIGFYSRPAPGVNAEVVIGYAGGPENPVILATRDEDTRKKVAKLEENETATFNTLTIVHHTNEGFVEIRTPSGAAFALPTLAEYNALRNAFNSHTHHYIPGSIPVASTGGPDSITDPIPVPPPTGTQVLRTH